MRQIPLRPPTVPADKTPPTNSGRHQIKDGMTSAPDTFGCNRCWPSNPDDMWTALRMLKLELDLVDESHFMVKVRSCPSCQQQFVSVFAETIDWADGDDPQFWCLLPIMPAETKMLLGTGGELITQLNSLAPERRSLCRDAPKAEAPTCYWGTGVVIGRHDS